MLTAGYDELELLKDDDVDPDEVVAYLATGPNPADKGNMRKALCS